jgi:hypothetical protein
MNNLLGKTIRMVNIIILGIVVLHFCTIEDLSFYVRDIGMAAMVLFVPFMIFVVVPLFSVSKSARTYSKLCFGLFFLYFILVGKLYHWSCFYKTFEELPEFLTDIYIYSERWMFVVALIFLFVNVIFAEYLVGDSDVTLYSRLKKEFPFI